MARLQNIFLPIISAGTLLCVFSCEVFTTPLITRVRDESGYVQSASTKDLVESLDSFTGDSDRTAAVLTELSKRNQSEIEKLSVAAKESVLAAAADTLLPVNVLTATVNEALAAGSNIDFASLSDSLLGSTIQLPTGAVETILNDTQVLESADAYILSLSAAAVVVSVLQQETTGGKNVADTLQQIQTAVKSGSVDSLTQEGFAPESITSLKTAVHTGSVLLGTAGDGEPNRRADTDKLSFGDFKFGTFLNDFLGQNGVSGNSATGTVTDTDGNNASTIGQWAETREAGI